MAVRPEVRTFLAALAFTDRSIDLFTHGLTEEQALVRLRDGEGPSILWTLGHIYEYRGRILESLDVEVDGTYRATFTDQPASDGTGYPTLEELKGMWSERATLLHDTLTALPSDAFFTDDGDPTSFYNVLVFHLFHEPSHMGCINLIRKEMGMRSAAEIVVGRMRENEGKRE